MIVAGAIDGINPCAFTVLLLFITAMTATLQVGEQNPGVLRSRLLGMGVILIAATSRPTLNRLARWNLHHKEWLRLALGGGVVTMGLLILATV